MIRDKIKSKQYFDLKVKNLYEGIDRFFESIKTGKTPPERVNIVKQAIVYDYLAIIGCKYSMGCDASELRDDLLKAITISDECWLENYGKVPGGKPIGSIYLSEYYPEIYDMMLWMLSLGYLFGISNKDFKLLVNIIDRDKVKDFLFEFIINAKINDRVKIIEETYQKSFFIPKSNEKLRLAISESDKSNAENLIKEFIIKTWYKNHKDSGWYNNHKSVHDSYSGYYSFETAAIVKIMGLDDSSFRDCEYYPKDLL